MKRWLLCTLAGCWLTSTSPPVDIRYYSPPHGERAAVPSARRRVRLGRVIGAAHLRYRIAHRSSAVELELEDAARWTEQPADYARRAIADALFGAGGFDQALTGDAPTVTVEVTAFEHVERAGQHLGRVELRYAIEDDASVIAEQVVTVERRATSAGTAHVVAAIGDALDAASRELASGVAARLARRGE